jgi:hypothetical protein
MISEVEIPYSNIYNVKLITFSLHPLFPSVYQLAILELVWSFSGGLNYVGNWFHSFMKASRLWKKLQEKIGQPFSKYTEVNYMFFTLITVSDNGDEYGHKMK